MVYIVTKEMVRQAATFIRSFTSIKPELGLILGSGLGALADEVQEKISIPYSKIPYFPVSSVQGHKGELILGTLQNKNVILLNGRFHLYEGYAAAQITFPLRVMKELGIGKLIVTNAAGGIHYDYKPGTLMLIADHLNFTGCNPLIGPNEPEFGLRFPDMSQAYSGRLRGLAKETAAQLGISLAEGVYAGFLGPSFETPAEIHMLRKLGADAVGMSTVAEVIVANHANLEVLGISCITNAAAGILDQPLEHEEVMLVAEQVRQKFCELVKSVVGKL